jgi:16S rRNA processing protein RimM
MTSSRICIAQLGAPHGVRGEMRLRSFTQVPEDFAQYGPYDLDIPGRQIKLVSARAQKDMFLVRIDGIDNRDAAALLTNQKLYVPRERLPELEEDDDSFYHTDLIGMEVRMDGNSIGRVMAVPDFGAGDLLEIQLTQDNTTHYLPFLKVFVPEINLSERALTITPPHNFFDEPDGERED